MGELGRILIEDVRKRLVEAYPAQDFAAKALHEAALDDIWTRTMR